MKKMDSVFVGAHILYIIVTNMVMNYTLEPGHNNGVVLLLRLWMSLRPNEIIIMWSALVIFKMQLHLYRGGLWKSKSFTLMFTYF